MTVRLLTGDSRDVLATLPDASVQCCITSPPYFGLRDYGTASWQGGDAGCDHLMPPRGGVAASGLNAKRDENGHLAADRKSQPNLIPYAGTCGKCGAIRIDQQIGLENSVEEYVAELVAVFREVRRVLRDDGVLFLNLGDSYASSGISGKQSTTANLSRHGGNGHNPKMTEQVFGRSPTPDGLKPKDLIGIPWRTALALQADGWYLRSDIIWAKGSAMPESVRDRPTKSHEHIFLLTKHPRYFYDAEAIAEPVADSTRKRVSQPTWEQQEGSYRQPGKTNGPMKAVVKKQDGHGRRHEGFNGRWDNADEPYPATRNARDVWHINPTGFAEAHFATFPPALAERCIKAGTSEKGACRACGAPWVRVVSERPYPAELANAKKAHGGIGNNLGGQRHQDWLAENPRETTGWQPTCTCDAPIVPCVVFDPFSGAGTVSLVSERLGRDSIAIELNPDYVQMAKKRIYDDAPMFAAVELA